MADHMEPGASPDEPARPDFTRGREPAPELPIIEVPEDPDEAQRMILEHVGGTMVKFDNKRRQHDERERRWLKAKLELDADERRRTAGPAPRGGDRAGPPLVVPEFYSEADVAAKVLPPVPYIVDGLLPVGAAMLSAPPKIGKTWLNFGLGRAVATGEPFCGARKVDQGPVLFLDLEGNERRAQLRSAMVRGADKPSELFKLVHEWPRMDNGGLELLEAAIVREGARLAIVDVWALFRAPRPKSADPYSWDMAQAKLVSAVAHRTRSAILVTHHNKKAREDDWVNDQSGSTGQSGGFDTLFGITRGRADADAVLKVTGRDIVDIVELAMSFKDGRWSILGTALDVLMNKTRQTIHSTLAFHGRPMKPAQVAEATDLGRDLVRKTLHRMLRDGSVKVDSAGGYSVAPGTG